MLHWECGMLAAPPPMGGVCPGWGMLAATYLPTPLSCPQPLLQRMHAIHAWD